MAGRIARSFVDELIARADIVELIGSRVPLKRAGHEYKACCPFHDEKTPSFWVSPTKQFYHCFGCGAHGTALGFLMQFDRLTFPEAVEELSTRLGLTLVYERPEQADAGSSAGAGTGGASGAGPDGAGADGAGAQALYALLSNVTGHYRSCLARSERARAYAQQRGLTPEIMERFEVGYAPDSWNEVLRRFGATEQTQRQLLGVGLIIERDTAQRDIAQHDTAQHESSPRNAPARTTPGTGYYDRFRDRLMLPIRDTRGRVIGFGGRVLGSGEPKYLNSPETALFHKGKELYGLFETRLARQSLKRLLIVEGYMDVVRLHQHGLAYAVATLGTATTAEHVRRAFRLVSELVFCFDGDRAGRAAAWRALQNVLPEARAGREIRFLFLPEDEDPDSLVGKEGGERFEQRVNTAVPLSEYLVMHLAEEADSSHADGKARFIALARPLLDKVAPGIYRDLLLERLAEALALPVERLQQWLARPPSAPASAFEPNSLALAPGASSASGALAPGPRRARPAGSARQAGGRGNLIAQAITLLLHFPAAATAVTAQQRAELDRIEQAGVRVLAELLDQLTGLPADAAPVTMARVLEGWRERPQYSRLCELAATVPLVSDAAAAAPELSEAVRHLLDRELRSRRLQTLIDKARVASLDDAEKLELQALTMDQPAGVSRPRTL